MPVVSMEKGSLKVVAPESLCPALGDTTSSLQIAMHWSHEIQKSRLSCMGKGYPDGRLVAYEVIKLQRVHCCWKY